MWQHWWCFSSDGVPEPQVTCELNSSSQSRHLLCSVTDEINVMYTWTGPDGLQSGQTLEIDEDEPSESLYICTVKNPVSQKNNSIILKDCSTGVTPHIHNIEITQDNQSVYHDYCSVLRIRWIKPSSHHYSSGDHDCRSIIWHDLDCRSISSDHLFKMLEKQT